MSQRERDAVHDHSDAALSGCEGGDRLSLRRVRVSEHAVYEGEDGAVMHAELILGNGMIMLGSATETEFGRNMRQPDEIGGKETQVPISSWPMPTPFTRAPRWRDSRW